MVKPILFNSDMVRAILDGRKTVTRRVVKGFIPNNALWGYTAFTPKGHISCRGDNGKEYGEKFYKLPYQIDDIMYVRESYAAWSRTEGTMPTLHYKADEEDLPNVKWKPSIHMPKEAARIFLRVTNVSVARLQDITTKDMQKEGLTSMAVFAGDKEIARQEWALLWNSTIPGKDYNKYCFSANPWVWIIEFERTEKPEDF
ncbi:MAG: hypothetical protein IIZ59_00310 [Clostridia bacterium]|nr:hypothetical protein [Clostridia bacterium]